MMLFCVLCDFHCFFYVTLNALSSSLQAFQRGLKLRQDLGEAKRKLVEAEKVSAFGKAQFGAKAVQRAEQGLHGPKGVCEAAFSAF